MIAIRNSYTATIMGWISGAEARTALSEGTALLARQAEHRRHLEGEINSVRGDMRHIVGLQRMARRVKGVDAANKFMADNECDLIGVPATPAALVESEGIYAEIHQIEDRHVDHGDGEYYSTPEQHLEFLRAQLADATPRGAAYTCTLLKFWPAGQEIDDTAEYVLEDGRRFATATEAQHADTTEEIHCLAQHGISDVIPEGDMIRLTKDGQTMRLSFADCRAAARQDDLTLRLTYQRILRLATR